MTDCFTEVCDIDSATGGCEETNFVYHNPGGLVDETKSKANDVRMREGASSTSINMAAETTKVTEQWFKKKDGSIVLRKSSEKGNAITNSETIYKAGELAPIPVGTTLLPYSMAAETTRITDRWFLKEDGSIVLQRTTQNGRRKTKSETTYKAGDDSAIPQGAVLLPYSMIDQAVDESSNPIKRLFSLAGLGCLFISLWLIWWAIIYPILVVEGRINRVFEWGDEKVNSGDESSSASVQYRAQLAILLLNGCLSVVIGCAV